LHDYKNIYAKDASTVRAKEACWHDLVAFFRYLSGKKDYGRYGRYSSTILFGSEMI